MIEIPRLEIQVADGCNLHCDSCAHYSNHGHTGMLTPEEAERQMALWSQRLRPRAFVLLGGEPSINPRLTEIVYIAARHFRASSLRMTTNGFFLHRHPALLDALVATGLRVKVSRHGRDPEYVEAFAPVLALLRDWHKRGARIRVDTSDDYWSRRYHGFGASMLPYQDGDRRSSWRRCTSWRCPQLRDGKIYKCPFLAYLPMQKAKFPALAPIWDLGLAYQPLEPSATDDEARAFFTREDEPQCGLCPAKPERYRKPSVIQPQMSARIA